jgi:WD40-like Beta Propeller Repeat
MKRTTCILGTLCILGMVCIWGMVGCDDDTVYDCETRADCASRGECVSGVCDCDTGYVGVHCTTCDIMAGYVPDGADGCVPNSCEDLDGDGSEGYDEIGCPLGEDECDDDPDNWSVGGCADCVDADGDGHGTGCDRGSDCDDADDSLWEDCNACIDQDNDGHGVNCTDGPDCNDHDPTVHRGCYRVWYWGDFDTDGTFEVANQFYPGGDKSTLPLAGVDTAGVLGGVAVSPDGGHLVVAASNPGGMAVLNLYTTDATGPAQTLAMGTAADQHMENPSFSPDGDWIAFTWNRDATAMQLFVVPVAGGIAQVVSPTPGGDDCDVTYYRWAPSQGANQHIAFVGDVDTDGQFALWGVEVTGASPMAAEIVSTAEATTLGVQPLLGFDDANRVYFISDFEQMGTKQLFRANLDGTGRDQVAGAALTNGGGEASVSSFGLNAAGTLLAISVDAPSVGLDQVYVIDLGVGDADRVSNVTTTAAPAGDLFGPGANVPIVWGPDDDYLAVISDWTLDASDLDDAYALYVLPTLNNGGERLVGVPGSVDQDVQEVAFAPSGLQIIVRGDLVADENTELFLTQNLWSVDVDPSAIRVEDVPTGGDVFGFFVVPVQ